ENSSFGSLIIRSEAPVSFATPTTAGRVVAEILPLQDTRPGLISLHISAKLAKNVRLFYASGGQKREVVVEERKDGKVPIFSVPVTWGRFPQTNVDPDADNIDLLFLAEDGTFVQIELSVTTRGFRFWFAIEELYSGQMVFTSANKAARIGLPHMAVGEHGALAIVPLQAEHAFPGANYLEQFKGIGMQFVCLAFQLQAFVDLKDCVVAKWQPPTLPKVTDLPRWMQQAGWKPAIVRWWNSAYGGGQVQFADGPICFVHFKAILDHDERPVFEDNLFPVLNAMTEVAVRPTKGKLPGQWRALAVKIPRS
ncbi:MAG: hypothetical protein AAB511_03860, partial [Patescibacteria group bacterium]